MTDWAQFFGRFHPVVLHFPIALLSIAFALTLAARRTRFERYENTATALLHLGALTTLVTAVLGYLLALGGGYDASVVNLHRWSGIGLTVLSLLLVWMVRRSETPRAYLPLFALSVGLMIWVGHLGGTLSRGPGYLLTHAPAPVRALFGEAAEGRGAVVIDDIEGAVVLDDLIVPVLALECGECHNPTQRRSELDLTTAEGLFEGGEGGLAIAEEGALSSDLFRRLILPASHEDAMPPSGRARLDPAYVEVIGWWLDEGAPRDATVGALDPDDRRLRLLRSRFGRPDPLADVSVRPASDRAIARSNEGPFVVERISAESPFVRARLKAASPDQPPSLSTLRRVREQIVELDLGGSGLGDDAASQLPDFKHLRRLDVHDTAITDEALRDVAQLMYLGSLNLFGTRVTDAGLDALNHLEHLEHVYAWNSGVTAGGSERLTAVLPRARVDLGVDSTRFAATQLPVPIITIDSAMFVEQATITLAGAIPESDVRYTLDGSDPGPDDPVFAEPFTVSQSTRVRAVATKPGWAQSPVGEAVAVQRGYVPAAVRLTSPPNDQYPGEGDATLLDGVLGSDVFNSPRWLGYREADLVATLDLGSVKIVGEVTVSALENVGSWIFPPAAIDVSVSADGTAYRRVASLPIAEPTAGSAPSRPFLTTRFEPEASRWVRVHIRRFGALPDWHPGSGEPAWLFVDEILTGPGAGDDEDG